MNVIKEIERINKRELDLGICGGTGKGSWHDKYKDSAWIYFGGFSYELSEGDLLCVLSQWGEIEDINLVRNNDTNKSMGFSFVKYEDQRSTILAVDNFNGIKLLGRTLRCDHVDRYKLPKNIREQEEKALDENPDREIEIGPGHAYLDKTLANEFSIERGQNVWEIAPKNKKRSVDKLASDYIWDDEEDRARNESSKVKKHQRHKEQKKHKHERGESSNRDSRQKGNLVSSSSNYLPEKIKGRDSHEGSLEPSDMQRGGRDIGVPSSSGDSRSSQMEQELARSSKAMFDQFSAPSSLSNAAVTQSGSFASWRGKRDPLVSSAASEPRRGGSGPEKDKDAAVGRRGEFDGFGGMLRRR